MTPVFTHGIVIDCVDCEIIVLIQFEVNVENSFFRTAGKWSLFRGDLNFEVITDLL